MSASLRKPLRVCFVAPLAYTLLGNRSDLPMGGAEAQVTALGHALARYREYRVSFLVGSFGQPHVEQFGAVTSYSIVPVVPNDPLWKQIVRGIRLFFFLRKIPTDVFITTTINPIIGIIALYVTLFRKKLIHRTAHEYECNRRFIRERGYVGKIFAASLDRKSVV